jgi:glycosyltransferase involved in cell wall biosynthesis
MPMISTAVQNSRILLVAAEFPPCGGGGVGRLHAIAKHLANSGSHVTVLTASKNNFSILNDSYSTDIPNLTVETVYSPNLKVILRRLRKVLPFVTFHEQYLWWARRAVSRFKSLHKAQNFDLVISSYFGFSNHWVAQQVSELANIPWIADFRDPPPWMYGKVPVPPKPEFSAFFSRPVALTVTTERTKQLFLKNYPTRNPSSIEVIENGCDELASQIERKTQNKIFTITHTGSFYSEGRDINQLIEVLKLIDKDISLQFIGDAPNPETNALLSRESLGDKVSFLPYLSSNEAMQASADSDALVVIQGKLFENQIPGKTYEYLAMQKPLLVITNSGSATWQVVANEPNVIIAEYGEQESIKNAVTRLLNHVTVPVDRFKFSRSHMGGKFTKLVTRVQNLDSM